MAGRGRGRRTMSFNVDSVGIIRGDGFPPSMQQPTPLFPVRPEPPLTTCKIQQCILGLV